MQIVIDALYGNNNHDQRTRIYCEWIRVPVQTSSNPLAQPTTVYDVVQPLSSSSLAKLATQKHSIRRRAPRLVVQPAKQWSVVACIRDFSNIIMTEPWHVVFERDALGSRMYPWGKTIGLHVPLSLAHYEQCVRELATNVTSDELYKVTRATAVEYVHSELTRVVSRAHLLQTWMWTLMCVCPPELLTTIRGIFQGATYKYSN